jgi:hypothetical protein
VLRLVPLCDAQKKKEAEEEEETSEEEESSDEEEEEEAEADSDDEDEEEEEEEDPDNEDDARYMAFLEAEGKRPAAPVRPPPRAGVAPGNGDLRAGRPANLVAIGRPVLRGDAPIRANPVPSWAVGAGRARQPLTRAARDRQASGMADLDEDETFLEFDDMTISQLEEVDEVAFLLEKLRALSQADGQVRLGAVLTCSDLS